MMGMLSRIIQDGFDLAGVRLLYPTSDLMKMTEGAAGRNAKTPPLLDKSRQLEVLNNIGKVTEVDKKAFQSKAIRRFPTGPGGS